MKFWQLFLIFLIAAIFACMLFGPAGAFAAGIIFVIVLTVKDEVNRTKSKEGRKQIQKELERDREIENYWGPSDQ